MVFLVIFSGQGEALFDQSIDFQVLIKLIQLLVDEEISIMHF